MINDNTEQSQGVHTVFISYNIKDKETATLLSDRLKEAGLDVIIQDESTIPGEYIPGFINRSIDNADAVLSLVSENSLLSSWVGEESMATLNQGDRAKRFIGCYLDKTFLEDDFPKKATDKIDEDIEQLEESFDYRFKKKIDTADLNAQRSRLINLRNDIDKIIANFQNSCTVDLRSESFDHSVKKLIKSFTEPADMPESKGRPQVVEQEPVQAPKSWFGRNPILLGLAAFFACLLAWGFFYEIPRSKQITKGVDTASRTFLRNVGRQDAKTIAESASLPFFVGDNKFKSEEELQKFFEKLFQYAKSDTGRKTDSVVVRQIVALSTYLSSEMLRKDRDVFKTVDIDIQPNLNREKEEDRGEIPPPRIQLSDGSRATIHLVGFKHVRVIYLYYSGGRAVKFRGILLVGDESASDI